MEKFEEPLKGLHYACFGGVIFTSTLMYTVYSVYKNDGVITDSHFFVLSMATAFSYGTLLPVLGSLAQNLLRPVGRLLREKFRPARQ